MATSDPTDLGSNSAPVRAPVFIDEMLDQATEDIVEEPQITISDAYLKDLHRQLQEPAIGPVPAQPDPEVRVAIEVRRLEEFVTSRYGAIEISLPISAKSGYQVAEAFFSLDGELVLKLRPGQEQ